MKPLRVILSASFLLFLSASFAFGASYPASCPPTAWAIVSAVGGCAAISPSQYGAIYSKCCSLAGSVQPATPTPSPKPKLVSAPTPAQTPVPSSTPTSTPTSSSSGAAMVVIILILAVPWLIGTWLSHWYLKRKTVNQKLIHWIVWSNAGTWLLLPIGMFTAAAAIVFSRIPNAPKKKYMMLAFIPIIVAALSIIFFIVGTINQ